MEMLNVSKFQFCIVTFALVFALTPSLTKAKAKVSKKELSEIADQVAFPLGDMQACGQAFGEPYLNLAVRLETNLRDLFTREQINMDAFWGPYSRKVATLTMLTKGDYGTVKHGAAVDAPEQVELRRHSEDFRSACKTNHILAKSAEQTLHDALEKFRPQFTKK